MVNRRGGKLDTKSKGTTGKSLSSKKETKIDERERSSPNPDIEHDPENPDDQWLQPKLLIKPDDQLQLDEAELETEFTRILSANNPHAPQNIARYNYKERGYKCSPNVEQLFMHFEMDGSLLFKGGDEGKRQLAGDATADGGAEKPAEGGEVKENAEEPAAAVPQLVDLPPPPKKETLRNQFNFSERSSQTFNNPHRDRGTSTEPPPRATFSSTATQWEIYDAYMLDQRQKQQKEKKDKKTSKDEGEKKKRLMVLDANQQSAPDDVIHNGMMAKSAKIVERMVNQNTYDDIAQDFKYWEDQSDEFRDVEGTLLPLWKFTYERAKKKAVTSLCFNRLYKDMFAVAYGSYDFLKQGSGLICCFSLKNPSFPEYIFQAESGVMCLDFHAQHPSLLVCGLYDGSVVIFDVGSQKTNKPIFQSTTKSGKHTDPVWQVCWQEDDLDKNLNFCSVSSDGRVTSWTLVKNELHYTDIIELRLVENIREDEQVADKPQLFGLACGTTFDFNHKSDHLFIVGTEEGTIYKCSKAYNSQYLDIYDAHHMAVYTVRWNTFHKDVFISCSADWTIKIWHHSHKTPIVMIDLKTPVSDVVWAPYSATVFACVTSDGKVRVYDLNVNKHDPICEQAVVRKSKLTHLTFNPFHPIIIVGDDRGGVTSLKLSPNLRKNLAEKSSKSYNHENFVAQEVEKMNKLLVAFDQPEVEDVKPVPKADKEDDKD